MLPLWKFYEMLIKSDCYIALGRALSPRADSPSNCLPYFLSKGLMISPFQFLLWSQKFRVTLMWELFWGICIWAAFHRYALHTIVWYVFNPLSRTQAGYSASVVPLRRPSTACLSNHLKWEHSSSQGLSQLPLSLPRLSCSFIPLLLFQFLF